MPDKSLITSSFTTECGAKLRLGILIPVSLKYEQGRPYFVPMVMRGIFFAGSVFAALLTAFIQVTSGIAALEFITAGSLRSIGRLLERISRPRLVVAISVRADLWGDSECSRRRNG